MVSVWHVSMAVISMTRGTGTASHTSTTLGIGTLGIGTHGIVPITMADGIPSGGA